MFMAGYGITAQLVYQWYLFTRAHQAKEFRSGIGMEITSFQLATTET